MVSLKLERDHALAFASVLGVAVVLFWPLVLGLLTGEPRWFEWDVPEQYWPDLVYLCDGLHEGVLPTWNPYDRAGYPYYADPQAGIYDPLNWLICGLAGSSPGPAWADARVVIGFVLAGAFGLAWLREVGCSWSGAIVGATLLMAAPFMRHNWELNLTGGFAWCGAMLWACERIMQRRRPLDGLWLGLAIGGCAWVGSPPALWQASTFTLLYAVVRATSLPRAELRALAAPMSIALVASCGLVGAVLVPGLTLSELSVQAGRSFASIADGALGDASAIWAPQPGNHLHVGWIAMALATIALLKRRPAVTGMWCIAVVAVALTFGSTVFRIAFDYVPGFSLFRLPHRYEAWLGPVSALCAAQGIEALRDVNMPRLATWWGAIAGLLAGLCFAAFEARGVPALCLGVGCIVVARERLDSPWLGIALGALVLMEVTVAMPPERHLRTGPRPGLDTSALIDDTRREWRYVDEFVVSCRSGTRTRHRELRGYQDPLTLRRFSRFLGSMREHPQLAMQLNARWALQGPHFIHGNNRHFLPPPDELERLPNTHRTGNVIEMRQAMPFAYWVPWQAAEEVTDEDAAMESLKRVAPARVALLEEVAGVMGVFGGPRVRRFDEVDAYDVELERDSLAFRIDVPTDGVVVVNEAWYPGWNAWVDGEPTPVFRANLVVRAIPIDAGSHRVVMRFQPDDRHWRTVWWVTLLGVVVMLGFRRWSRKTPQRATQQRTP